LCAGAYLGGRQIRFRWNFSAEIFANDQAAVVGRFPSPFEQAGHLAPRQSLEFKPRIDVVIHIFVGVAMRHLLSASVLIVGSLAVTWLTGSLFEYKAVARAAAAQTAFAAPPSPGQAWDLPVAQATQELRAQ
jgi:hypothetical protein